MDLFMRTNLMVLLKSRISICVSEKSTTWNSKIWSSMIIRLISGVWEHCKCVVDYC